MVEEMLSVAEMEAGSYQLRSDDVRLDALLAELQADYRAQTDAGRLRLHFELPPKLPVIQADREKLVLALHNLLGNAVKYTPPGGEVKVAVEADEGEVRVEIADTGIGIRPEDLDFIFDKFYRANDPRVAEARGSCLGLSLAREIARLHGGDILARSEFNRGSEFTLRMPTGRRKV
jgi:signal transduction histidine kinase